MLTDKIVVGTTVVHTLVDEAFTCHVCWDSTSHVTSFLQKYQGVGRRGVCVWLGDKRERAIKTKVSFISNRHTTASRGEGQKPLSPPSSSFSHPSGRGFDITNAVWQALSSFERKEGWDGMGWDEKGLLLSLSTLWLGHWWRGPKWDSARTVEEAEHLCSELLGSY